MPGNQLRECGVPLSKFHPCNGATAVAVAGKAETNATSVMLVTIVVSGETPAITVTITETATTIGTITEKESTETTVVIETVKFVTTSLGAETVTIVTIVTTATTATEGMEITAMLPETDPRGQSIGRRPLPDAQVHYLIQGKIFRSMKAHQLVGNSRMISISKRAIAS